MNISIDRDIPIPTQGFSRCGPITTALRGLEVNESALLPTLDRDDVGAYMRSAKRGTDKKFVSRKVADGIRVWRVA